MPVKIDHMTKDAQPVPQGGKRLFVKSYGCQMNVYDGMRMAEMLAPMGYQLQDNPAAADLIVLNPCHIREKADDKLFSDIGRFKTQAADRAIIAVGGCVGQALGAKVYQQSPAVSVVFGPQTYHRLPQFVEQVEQGRQQRQMGNKNAPIRVVDTEFPLLEKFDHLPTPGAYGPTAFVTIQEGCDKFCTYCVVPYTRGAEISRPVTDIVTECRQLAEQGVREITLLGQNVNAFHGEDARGQEVTLAVLLEMLSEIDGLERLRFTTSHPNNTGADLIEAFKTNSKLMPYFHLPVQAGSDKILRAMNRNHTAQEYLEVVYALREARPDLALSGDFIIGFPGETEADFEETLNVMAAANYASAYAFAYSPRPGTPAADMPGQVPEAVKKERLAGVLALLEDQMMTFHQSFVGQTVEVLVEEAGQQGQMRGKNPHNVSVNFAGDAALVGQIVPVKIHEARPRSLVGTLHK